MFEKKNLNIFGLFMAVALMLQPFCPVSEAQGKVEKQPGSTCHSHPMPMEKAPVAPQHHCCVAADHHQPAIPVFGHVISLGIAGDVQRASEFQPQIQAPSANPKAPLLEFPPPLTTALRI
jgi:hypothetical protein